MDFFNQISKQVSELFASMKPGARVTAGLLLAVVIVSVGYLFQQSTAGPDEYLFGAEPLSGTEINAMTAAMSQAGLNEFEVQGAHIRVPRGQRNAYIAAVADAGALPTHAKDFMINALDKGSVFDTREVKNQRMKLAVEQEFSHIIGWFPWVQQASVIYDLKSVNGPRRVDSASATVSVLPKAGESIDSRRARNIQKLVAGGFTSMSPDDVTVNNLGGEDSFGGIGGDTDAEQYETPYHRERARVENELRRDILGHLKHIPGVGVQVSAILDDTMQTTRFETKPDTQAVAISEVIDEENITEKTTDNVGRPGVTANGPRGPRVDDPPQREQSRESIVSKTVTDNKVGESTTQTVLAGMAAKEIQASIAIPRSYLIDVWKQQQQLLTGSVPEQIDKAKMDIAEQDLIDKVKGLVKPLLPKLQREDDYQQVNVMVIDTPTPAALPEPSLVSNAMSWTTRHGSMLAMVGVAVFSLLMLRSVVKASPDGDASDMPVLQLDGEGNLAATGAPGGSSSEEEEEARPKLKLRKAESLKDDLSEIVREDPDAAAAILRGWIGNAS